MVPKFEMSTYFYSNVIWLQSGPKISTLIDFLSQFEMNAEMDISKNQWRSTGGMNLLQGMFVFVGKEIEILQ